MNFIKKALPYILILFFSFLAFKPLLTPGFFPIHDNTQVARVYEMTKSLKDGMFPVRWTEDLGYGFGYPIFNFYDPLPYYVGGLIGVLGIDALSATKIIMILGIILSAVSMYILAREFWGEMGGILSAFFYLYAPYHAVDVYIRGDVAEFWAYSFIPLVFYGLWKIGKTGKWKYVVISAISYAAVIISHNLTAMMITPFVLLFTIYLLFKFKREKKSPIYLFSALILGILISSFYSLPAIFEMNYTNVLSQVGGGADFRNHFVCPLQLWISQWGYGGSAPGCADGISFMIGKYHMLLSVILTLSIILFLSLKKNTEVFIKEKEKFYISVLFFLGFLISIFFTLEVSRFVWEFIPPMGFFQYPWRFLILAVFFSSFISGSALFILSKFLKNNKYFYLLSFVTFIFIVTVSLKFFVPQEIISKNSSDYTNLFALKWVTSKISDEYMPRNFQKPKSPADISNILKLNSKSIEIKNINKNTKELNLKIKVYKDTSEVLPIAYFPSWKGYLDGKSINLYENEKGMLVNLPVGDHNLRLTFFETPIEKVGNLLSLSGIVILFIGIIRSRKKV